MIRTATIVGILTVPGVVATGQRASRPMVVAHRGLSSVYPENTLVSVRAAVELGADWVEIDTYLSKDRIPVLSHDESLERTTGKQGKVGDYTAEQLATMDAGSWKDARFSGEKIATLEEALSLTMGKSILVIEIKQAGMEKEVLEVLNKKDARHEVMIFSFHPSVIARMHALDPSLPSTWLLGDLPKGEKEQRKVLDMAGKLGASCVGVGKEKFQEGFVKVCHLAGFPLAVWTVDDPEEQKNLIEAGVDYIITNRADQLIEILKR